MYKAIAAVLLCMTAAATSLAADLLPAPQASPTTSLTDVTPQSATRTYIIQMKDKPGVSYDGGLAGFAATAPVDGERYDANAGHVQSYTSHLIASHDQMLAGMGASARKIYSYCHTMNGFAARLTPAQARSLKAHDGVLDVFEDYATEVDTNDTPSFLGLKDRRDGLRSRLRLKGENVIVGILDTGAVQEHPSFSDTLDINVPKFCDSPASRYTTAICSFLERLDSEVVYDAPPARWTGVCQAGEAWSEEDCNNKMIGARWYVDGFIAGSGSVVEGEFLSPRDSSGHGSHTASTAVGNKVTARLNGTRVARISGMAPRARLAVYKVCWLAPESTNFSCFFSDSAAATDQAVADGVDVLNFSVGTAPSFVDQQDLAFLNASSAGVFVARSGGNDGPAAQTINAGEPWVTSVAASTAQGTTFVQGVKIKGPRPASGKFEAVEGGITQPIAGTEGIKGKIMATTPLDACGGIGDDLTGKIALVQRGTCGFVEKVEAAASAGAIGIIVFTDDRPKVIMGGDATELSQSIPGVMVDQDVGQNILDQLVAGSRVRAVLNDRIFFGIEREGNIMANFSSRGPFVTEPNWIKPDITAPGVNVLAAFAPDQADGSSGDLFGYLSGTSMSGPHIAGLGALLKEARPDWSPAQIKSALMTTARQDVVKEDGETPADPFDFGAGHVVPNGAVSPGLTYDAGLVDYLAASCGTVSPVPGVTPENCAFLQNVLGLSTDPADLNLPSIGIDRILGSKTVTRTVTAVADYRRNGRLSNRAQRYTAVVEAPEGFDVQVSPSELSLRPGESATFELTATNVSAAPGTWLFGALTWVNEKGNDVRSPIAVNALAFVTEDEIDGAGPEGAAQFDLTFGYTGEYTAQVHGLNDAGVFLSPPLVDDADDTFAFSFADPSTLAIVIDDIVPGTAFRRWSVYNEYTTGNDDFDMYLFYCPEGSCTQIASSANVGSDESVDVTLPEPFDADFFNPYVLFIHAFDTEADDATLIYFDQQFGVVDDAGNLTVTAPTEAQINTTAPVSIEWSGLVPGPLSKQLGAISHSDANGIQALTIVDIENDAGITICDLGLCPEPEPDPAPE